ncbi:MAG: hypothetical protein WCL23_04675 [Candidatus Moraniibacteriota bacterium]
MIEILTRIVADHWALATYFSVMILNESAILSAFGLAVGDVIGKYPGIASASVLGLLTNDSVIFALARFWPGRMKRKEDSSGSVMERTMTHNVFLSLLFVKFLFGIRFFATLYLVDRKRIPFWKFIAYDACGSTLYVSVLGVVGWCAGNGVGAVSDAYHGVILVMGIVAGTFLFTHLLIFVFRRYGKPGASVSDPESGC